MLSALYLLRLIITIITGISSTIICSLIFKVYFRHWREVSTVSNSDKIQFVTVLTNVLFQHFVTVDSILEFFEIYRMLDKYTFLFLVLLQYFLIQISFWNTAMISIFYSLSLVNVSYHFCLLSKARFTSSVPQLIMGSVISSIVINIPLLWPTTFGIQNNNNDTLNVGGYVVTWNSAYLIFSSLVGCALPLSMTCLCIGLSVTTLLRHIWRMKQGQSHVTSPQLQGLIRAVRTMIGRFILDITFYSLTTPIILSSMYQYDDIFQYILWLFLSLYPAAQTLILIFGNPRLKSRLWGHSVTT